MTIARGRGASLLMRPAVATAQSHIAPRIDQLERELELERCERRELAENRRLYQSAEGLLREKADVLRENGLLREKIAPWKGNSAEVASHFDEHRNTRSSEKRPPPS